MRKKYVLMFMWVIVLGLAVSLYFYTWIRKPIGNRLKGIRVLAIIAEGFDYTEYMGVVSYLKKEGAEVDTASFTVERIEGHGGSYVPDTMFNEVNVSHYHVIFIPGGDGPYNIIHHENNQTVFKILTEGFEQEKIIAAICHGPWVLAAADLVDGVSVTCWPDQEMIEDLKAHGALVDTQKSVVRDGNIVTANGPAAINPFAEEIVSAVVEKYKSVAPY
jgi:protease I